MSIAREWTNHGDDGNTTGTTATVSLSGSTDGDWIYLFWSSNGTITASSLTCVTNGLGTVVPVQAQTTFGSNTGVFGGWKIQKTSTDTTLTVSWATARGYNWLAQQWSGIGGDEGWSFKSVTGAGNTFTTNSATPTDATRTGVGIFGGVNGGIGIHATTTWTPTAPMAEIIHENGIAFAEADMELCDTNGPVVNGSAQSYTSVSANGGGTVQNNGFAAIFFLIPQPTTASASIDLVSSANGALIFSTTPAASVTLTATVTNTLNFSTTGSASVALSATGTGTLLGQAAIAVLGISSSASATLKYPTTGAATVSLSGSISITQVFPTQARAVLSMTAIGLVQLLASPVVTQPIIIPGPSQGNYGTVLTSGSLVTGTWGSGGISVPGTPQQLTPSFLHVAGQQLLDGNGSPIQLRGVAVGTWLLWEHWLMGAGVQNSTGMTTMLSKLATIVGATVASQFQTTYQNTFITQADFQAIASYGFNCVRIPFNARYLDFTYFDNVVNWAAQNHLYIIFDMHAAPYSQNPYFTSDDIDGTSAMWYTTGAVAATANIWQQIATRYANNPTVVGYDLLNEPDGLTMTNAALVGAYAQIISAIRAVDQNHIVIVEGRSFDSAFAMFNAPLDPNLILSLHQYWSSTANPAGEIASAEAAANLLGNVPVWVGEYGLDIPSNITTQVALFKTDPRVVGWSYWTWKMALRTDNQHGLNEYNAPASWVNVINWLAGKSGATQPNSAQAQQGMADLLVAINTSLPNTQLIVAATS